MTQLMRARRPEIPPLLDPLAALEAAILRARAELPQVGQGPDLERLEHAAGDVMRALVWARHRTADLEMLALAALDEVAHAVGAPLIATLGSSRSNGRASL